MLTFLEVGLYCSILSLAGGLFSIFAYLCLKSSQRNFFFFLVFHLAISDLIVSFTGLTKSDYKLEIYCQAIATLRTFGVMQYLILNVMIALYLYRTVAKGDTEAEKSRKRGTKMLFAYVTSILCAIGPLTTESYGQSALYCWVEQKNPEKIDIYWLMFFIFVVIPIALVMVTVLYISLLRSLKANSEIQEYKKVNMIAVIPLIFIICQSLTLADQILEKEGITLMAVKWPHLILRQLQGFFTAILFGVGLIRRDKKKQNKDKYYGGGSISLIQNQEASLLEYSNYDD